MPAAIYNELFSKISDGNLTPRLFKKTESPIERLDLTFGNEIKIIHQNMICKSTGTFLTNSTYIVKPAYQKVT